MNNSDHLRDLKAFLLVCEAGNFTRAAAGLGVTQSALSQAIRGLEARLGLRLFDRSTRSVAPTEAGQRLRALIAPAIEHIEQGLDDLLALRDRPAGNIRLTADEYAVEQLILPMLPGFLADYPDIQVEVSCDHQLGDIISGHFDAGIRRGGLLAKDMIAMQIGSPTDMALVGTQAYFEALGMPDHPRQLIGQRCIQLRLPTHGELFAWRFRKGRHEHSIKTSGPVVFNTLAHVQQAARSGLGLAWLPLAAVAADLRSGALVQALEDWHYSFEAYYLYYPDRRHSSAAFSLFRDALKVQFQRRLAG